MLWKRMLFLTGAAAIGVLMAILHPATGHSQTVCGDHGKFVSHLGKSFSEFRSGLGLAANGSVIELMTASNGNWTLLVTLPNGRTCVVATGKHWQALTKVLPSRES